MSNETSRQIYSNEHVKMVHKALGLSGLNLDEKQMELVITVNKYIELKGSNYSIQIHSDIEAYLNRKYDKK